jgi:hypothetical protein
MIGLVFFLVFLEKLLYDVCLMGIIKKSTRRGAKLDPIRIPTVKMNGQRRYKYLLLGRDTFNFANKKPL